MATHDYVIDNSTGANVRSDINNVLQAILTNNSSSSAPSTTAAYMWWADTTTGILKIRNSSDNAWVELFQLDGTLTLEDGSASTPGLAFRDDLNTGIFSSAADTFNVATGGVERMELGATTIFNEDGADVDFRIEGDTEANLFYVDAGNDRIGIGLSTPTSLFHVKDSSGSANAVLTIESESASDAILLLDSSTGGGATADVRFARDGTVKGRITFINSGSSAGDMVFAVGSNSEAYRIDSSGRVLIGHSTVTPVDNDANNPHFQVEGTNGNDSRISIRHNSTSSSSAGTIYLSRSKGTSTGAKTSVASGDALGNLIFMGADGTHDTRAAIIQASCDGTPGDNDMPGRLEFFTTPDGGLNATEKMRIDSFGHVGIGVTPANSFSFGKALDIGSSTGAFVYVRDTDVTDAVGGIGYSTDGLFIGNEKSDGYIRFSTNTSATERARIDSTGRFLVGTTSARAAFSFTSSAGIQAEGTHSKGSISSTNNENNSNTCAFVSAKIRGTGAVSNNDIIGSHVFEGFDGTAFRRIARIDGISKDSGAGISNNVISGDLVFYTRINDLNETEVARFTHNRLALFGTDVLPSASAEGVSIDCDPADLPVFIKTSSRQHGSNAYTHYQMFTSAGQAGNILCSGTTTSYNSGSDYRLKENETPITDGIVRLKQLKPYKFNWKHSPSADKVDGFFAHEVSSIVPEAISGEKDAVATEANVKSGLAENVGDMITQQIDQSKLVPLLVAAVQELITKVETLEAA